MTELSSVYDPKATEEKQIAKGKARIMDNALNPKPFTLNPFTILLPPPNITGSLHMGHALNATMSDVLIRYHRLKGRKAVWLPGIDHAGIATQNVVEKQLKKEGKTRFDLGREAFIARVWQWKEQSGGIILNQLKKLGASCDWGKSRFTMDPAYARAVQEAFIHYHERGLVYRAERVVNWCPRCRTSISDLEVEYKEEKTTLYYIQYGPFMLATVRPETKFGDTTLAVHPDDERYQKYIGAEVEIETIDADAVGGAPQKKTAKLTVVGDEAVDKEFGTGVIKVTPAHDITDYEIAARHNLPMIKVIDERGRMSKTVARYAGMKISEAREKTVRDLEALGLLTKKESYTHNLAVCSRCSSAIEPLPSWQWFVKMTPSTSSGQAGLAAKAAEAVRSGQIKIIPQNFEIIYFNWLENIRDWCISRQLWWGHQLPVFFCRKKQGGFRIQDSRLHQGYGGQAGFRNDFVVSLEKPAQCPFCKECEMEQSEDVLDTWFSSALWPFAGIAEEDVKELYPSSILITARDIINLWVGRMIFSGLEFKGAVPFPEVLIHATVLTKDGRRMSKSLGTGLDPMDLIEKYGADATRFGIIWQAMGGQDICFDEAAVMAGKKFANKVWNAARFALRQAGISNIQYPISNKKLEIKENKEIIEKLEEVKKTVERHIEKYELGHALHTMYGFFWHGFCDEYLEWAKKNDSEETQRVLMAVLRDSLVLLHPFMPFITEELYQRV